MSEEVLDIFDEKGEWAGTAPRSKVHRDGLWHKTAQVWVLNEKNELLLQLRSAEKECFPSLWDISSAGHIPAGCDIVESAVRELDEELGVCVLPDELEFLFNNTEPYEDAVSGHIDREIAFVYLVSIPSETEFNLQKEEVAEIRWINFTDLLPDFRKNRKLYVPHEAHFTKLTELLSKRLSS